jgi:hypothetical protein
VFGVSSDELELCPEESSEWEDRGLEVVAGLWKDPASYSLREQQRCIRLSTGVRGVDR